MSYLNEHMFWLILGGSALLLTSSRVLYFFIACGRGGSTGKIVAKIREKEKRLAMVFIPAFYYVGPSEQILIQTATTSFVFNGPGRRFCTIGEQLTLRQAQLLDKLTFVKVQDTTTGENRIETGPKLLFLGAFDKVLETGKVVTLGQDSSEYLLVENMLTGERSTVRGPRVFVPGPYETVLAKMEATSLKMDEYVYIKNQATGHTWMEKGPKLLFLEPTHQLVGSTRKAVSLKANEYIHIMDLITGKVRMIKGEMQVFPLSTEAFVGGETPQQAISLKAFEFVKIQDGNTGKVRVERGEKIVFLEPTERKLGPVTDAPEVNEETAILVRDRSTGQQQLVTTHGLFFPSAHEEIMEVRKLQTLADYEVMILRDKEGAFSFFHGAGTRDGEKRAFFVPPHCDIVTLLWSRGRRREKRDLKIQKIDCRPQYMSFEFNCRTNDNVELVLEGTFFWQIVDVQLMMQNTGDASGDICSHARSQFIQLVSKVTLQAFMADFNTIARQAYSNDDDFYKSRGVKIHMLEVTGYWCPDDSTAKILQNIVQETTNRMNRLSQQESENEVKLHKMKGDIEQANLNTDLLEIKLKQMVEEARVQGTAEAERVLAFLAQLEKEVPSIATRVEVWNTLRKNDALRSISQGTAHVFFTPNDCNLSIDHSGASAIRKGSRIPVD
eukprot:c11145_g1_i1.p1 GENE.c11145_g1_i1~~c11145_g1_i1.p1  ORF type:complete len:681 (-),score=175.38 c11145_g1_i1:119-2119(-)